MAPRAPADPPSEPPDWAGLTDLVISELGAWLGDRCARAAKELPGIEAGDVFAATVDRLIRSRTRVDPQRNGVRTFLGRCVDWAVSDLLRKREREGGLPLDQEEFDRRLEESSRPEPDPVPLDRDLLAAAGLTPNQVDVVLKDVEFPELTWKEFAQLVGRPYTAVRKDRERAVRRLEHWLGLDDDERRVYLAHRRTGSIAGTAARTGLPEPDCLDLVRSARRMIHHRLHPREEG